MALFKFKWLRRKIRRHTNPIPLSIADTWKRKLSVVYALIAWNAFGIVIYQVYKGKSDWASYHGLPKEGGTSAQQYAKILNIPNANVIRVSGTTLQDGYEIRSEEDSNSID